MSSASRSGRRLAELPFRAAREDRPELTLLRIAYSRDAAIEASFAADSTLLVDYRLVGRMAAARQRLEALADLDLLRRRFFCRTHACGRCGSARLHAYEACPACGSGDLVEEPIVHHYRCGWQAPESRFANGSLLVCPIALRSGTGATITGWYDGSRGRWSTDHKRRRLFDKKHEAKSICDELRSLCPRNAKVINIEPEQLGNEIAWISKGYNGLDLP